MRLAASLGDWETVSTIAQCPASRQVTTASVSSTLFHLLASVQDGHVPEGDFINMLLGQQQLPAGLAAPGCFASLPACTSHSRQKAAGGRAEASYKTKYWTIQRLLDLPAAQHLSPHVVLQASAQAPAHLWTAVMLNIINLPATQQFSADSVLQGLRRALGSADAGAVNNSSIRPQGAGWLASSTTTSSSSRLSPGQQAADKRSQSMVFERLLKLGPAHKIPCGRVYLCCCSRQRPRAKVGK
jgi:hypothetical protein